MADPAARFDRGRLEQEQSGAGQGPVAAVDVVPVGDAAVVRRVLAHGRDDDAVGQFERAELIQRAFFPTGNAFPSIGIQIEPRSLSEQADSASLEVNSNLVQVSRAGGGFGFGGAQAAIQQIPANFDWPGNTASSRVALVVLPEVPGYQSRYEINGDWAFYRYVQQFRATSGQREFVIRQTLGGRQVSFNVKLRSTPNPFFLSALSEFKCPQNF